MSALASDSRESANSAFYLPDFCSGGAVLAVVLIVELVALILTIAPRRSSPGNFWIDLASISLFLLWLGLGSAAALCRARPWLSTMRSQTAYALALAILLLVVALVSEAVFQLGHMLTGGLETMGDLFPQSHGEFVLRNLAIAFIVSSLALRYFHVSAEWKRSIELEARARIRALQARIRPHFLFNSMNTIAALTRSDPLRAEEAIEDLADLFRASLSDAQNLITIEDEFAVTRVYQRIEQLRLGDRLQVKWSVEDVPIVALIPSLCVQPLLENAIYHGIERMPQGGVIGIEGRCANGIIEIELTNPVPTSSRESFRDGNRLALDNIRQRLELAWPDRSQVLVRQEPDRYCITLIFPDVRFDSNQIPRK
jgi:two-component system sensor histidine kinase AlgZ